MAATVEIDQDRQDSPACSGSLMSECSSKAGWSPDAPGKIRKAGDPQAFLNWLRDENRRSPLAELGKGGDALSWGLALGTDSPADLLLDLAAVGAGASPAKAAKAKRKSQLADAVQQWLGWAKEGEHADEVEFAASALAVANMLPAAAHCCDAETWWDALDALTCLSARAWTSQYESAGAMLCGQLLGVELPLTLAAMLPEIQRCCETGRLGAERLKQSAEELLNGEGLPHGDAIGGILPLVACWTRLLAIGGTMKKSPWSKAAKSQYGWLVRQALRWTAADGRTLMADATAGVWTHPLAQAALSFGGDASDAAAAEKLLGRKFVGKLAGAAKTHEPPEPGDHCEWSGMSLLRTDWTPRATILAIDATQPTMQIELRVGEQRVLSGAWKLDWRLAGKSVELDDAWEETCWFSDDDVDFIEFVLDLPGGASVTRQLMLARDEKALFLADYCTTGGKSAMLDYSAKIPLAAGCDFAAERETRDGLLVAGSTTLRTLPLALAEWRTDPRGGEIAAVDGQLQWTAQRQGTAVAAPLAIDLRTGRSQKQCTWRQLTVAEGLEIQTPDVAVGYRAQSGKDQWLFYRSIGPRGNRSLMGQNTASEFVAAKFLPETGLLQELVEIEG